MGNTIEAIRQSYNRNKWRDREGAFDRRLLDLADQNLSKIREEMKLIDRTILMTKISIGVAVLVLALSLYLLFRTIF